MYLFQKSNRKHKKYKVTFQEKGKTYNVHFGDVRYQQFKDSTPLKLYSHLDHKDKERRKRYLARATKIRNKEGQLTKNNKKFANYWAIKYLW